MIPDWYTLECGHWVAPTRPPHQAPTYWTCPVCMEDRVVVDAVPLTSRWACLRCDTRGEGPRSDLEARRHEKATSHDTLVHLSPHVEDVTRWDDLVDRVRSQLHRVDRVKDH